MKFENPFSKTKKPDDDTVDTGRRKFLKTGALLAGAGLVEVSVIHEARNIYDGKEVVDYQRDFKELLHRTELLEKIVELKLKIQETYGITIELSDDEIENSAAADRFGFVELRATKQIEALEILDEELSKYPPVMIRESGLINVLVTARTRKSDSTTGYASDGHTEAVERSLQPELNLAYDFNSGNEVPEKFKWPSTWGSDLSPDAREVLKRANNTARFKGTIHHELSHFFLSTPGTESSPRHEEANFMTDWEEKFGSHHEESQLKYARQALAKNANGEETYSYVDIEPTPPGFAASYGLKNTEEDRATVSEFIMTNDAREFETDESDVVLRDKIRMMKNQYFKFSCGLMDAAYWDIRGSELIYDALSPEVKIADYFKQRARYIIDTPYQNSVLEGEVSEETYGVWQQKLAKLNTGQ
jgi:hypothetical protein